MYIYMLCLDKKNADKSENGEKKSSDEKEKEKEKDKDKSTDKKDDKARSKSKSRPSDKPSSRHGRSAHSSRSLDRGTINKPCISFYS